MGYTIEPMPVISFLDENKMQLPRFQRKATWSNKQNFELCISVFQEYPVGVVIVNKEKTESWLLDGRQRRTALKVMRDNPVILYDWAISFLKFKKRADPTEITNIFWGKIAKYLQTETSNKTNKASEEIDDEEVEVYYDNEEDVEVTDIEIASFNRDTQKKGLQTLLDLILMVHQKKPMISAWENLFNYRDLIPKLTYAPGKHAINNIDPVLLRRFILHMQREFEKNNRGEITQDYFIEHYNQQFVITDENFKKFKGKVEQNWTAIKNSFGTISKAEKVFSDARIGIIWLINATALDAQNIFSRINGGGTQLKAEELLSAKPYWNIPVGKVTNEVKDEVGKMYERLDIPKPDFVVRWDMAAIMLSRIDQQHLIFDSYEASNKKNEISLNKVTLGFKLLSSIFCGGMSAKNVADLENISSLSWENDIDKLVDEINKVIEILMNTSFFQTLQAWKQPIAKLLGNAIALEFITIVYLDWKERGKPTFASAELKAMQRDAVILYDRLVYEYATKVWRGSGDSKMANDIKNWNGRIVHVKQSDWEEYIEAACEGIFNGSKTNAETLRPVLYFYYVLKETLPINQHNVIYEIDHIIPQEKFKDNVMIDSKLQDSLANFALIPKKDNIRKSSKPLNEIIDPWLKSIISTYTGIDQKDFNKYSNIVNMVELKEERKQEFLSVFGSIRNSKLSN